MSRSRCNLLVGALVFGAVHLSWVNNDRYTALAVSVILVPIDYAPAVSPGSWFFPFHPCQYSFEIRSYLLRYPVCLPMSAHGGESE
jgi:hypothetical protein